ncbi:MAG: hypothetical protein LH645_12055 [Actinomycetia bacterium]|nr:hypothetical protein [Actinomycetes bacterium]
MAYPNRGNTPTCEDKPVIVDNLDNRPRNIRGTAVVDEQPNRLRERGPEDFERRLSSARTTLADRLMLVPPRVDRSW